MASVTFQPFIDKENTEVTRKQPVKSRLLASKGLGAKVFNSGTVGSTPRRALGDVKNTIPTSNTSKSQKPAALKPCNPFFGLMSEKPQQKKLSNNINKKKSLDVNKKKITETRTTVSKIPQKKKEIYDDEIEQMFIYTEPEEDFEDVMPKSERINSYIFDKLINFRIPCMRGTLSDSEEEETIERQKEIEKKREEADIIHKMTQYYDSHIKDEDSSIPQTLELEPLDDFDLGITSLSLLEVSP